VRSKGRRRRRMVEQAGVRGGNIGKEERMNRERGR
jgi:hypothetical protein